MEMNEKKNSITAVMEASMAKIREMVDSNTIVGEPITTPDGVTLIPVSRLSFGFGCGGGDYGKQPDQMGAAAGAGYLYGQDRDTMPACCRWPRPPSPRWIAPSSWCLRCWIGWRASSTARRRKRKNSEKENIRKLGTNRARIG